MSGRLSLSISRRLHDSLVETSILVAKASDTKHLKQSPPELQVSPLTWGAMSAIYNLEPQPTASAILHTTLGEIAVELFAKQTPLTCRNFLQLALDGYYDETIFHRLVPNFILQGGDPTGTGNGGESIYDGGAFGGDLDPWPMDQRYGKNAGQTGINFKDEFHSRLKFNRRGLLAMANEGRPDTNGSQFFFTLGKTEELSGKNTIFGRIEGDTIYNLMKIGESEVDETTERPLYPIKIQHVEILVNPFEDMKQRSRVANQGKRRSSTDKETLKKKRKGGKQLLSFDDEEGGEVVPVPKRAKFDTRIVAAGEDEDSLQVQKPTKKKNKKREASPEDTAPRSEQHGRHNHEGSNEPSGRRKPRKDDGEPEIEIIDEGPKKTALERANEEIAALKASMRRTVHSQEPTKQKPKSTLEEMIPETSIRGRKRKPGGVKIADADDARAVRMLKDFRSRLEKAPPERDSTTKALPGDAGKAEDDTMEDEAELCDLHFIANCQSCNAWDKQGKEESDDEGWMSHALSFAADRLGKDLSNRKKGEEELIVIDPREKARTFKEEKRAEREARAGKSGRAWDQARDQARNAKMAQAASLAGRGAK